MSDGRQILTEDLLQRIHDRAARYDAENVFPHEDLEDLRAAGYLTAMVPAELGGAGLTLEEMTREQMRLAAAAPATALAVNMHQVWVGVARTVHASGDDSCDFIFRDAAAGEIFGFGVSEAGNDLVLFGSVSEARPDGEGGYSFHGTKIFTSMAPVWTRLGTFATDSTGDDGPHNVWGFVTRDGGGVETVGEWDVLGMRASQSFATRLDGAHAPADRVVRRIPPGPTMDPFIFGIFANFEILLASVYTGLARRALELAVETVKRRKSLKNQNAPYSNDPDIRWRIADAAMQLDGIYPQIAQIARDVDEQVDRGALWMPQLSAVKSRATEVALDVVTKAVRVSGGSSYSNSQELSRLYRDVVAGLFHPSDDESVHGAWANAMLGPVQPWPPQEGDAR
ncbi:alkylation response protein AidB-like acyl-CoA dehydrogenase [Georgenia soli]|uniref:Alkylation response protein AidB-like acyl-CoA dehydrogenase n=1 Tax=Georgenia soli TaxID=638953 RepID=A0A2A9ENF6_9MICO|nr:acyl-CoA dehydrogenase family protein [Georgenia soli]PFG40323.1 alkylation response protein AidB-like acyl-CoA dehydrogenase [Georgenia soli]